MSTPTEEQINLLQSLLDAGTPGEWGVKWGTTLVCGEEELLIGWSVDENGCSNFEANLPLVAELYNHAPALLEAARENVRLRAVAQGVLNLIDPACMFENDTYGDSREENAKYRNLRTLAKAALGKETA